MVNRKLIRPKLAEIKERLSGPRPTGEGGAAVAQAPPAPEPQGPASRKRPVPPEQTSAEAFYYVKQMNNRTPMVVVLEGGEHLRGHIEWYDRACIKVHRQDGPNLLIFKHAIKYLFKQEEEGQGRNGSESVSSDNPA